MSALDLLSPMQPAANGLASPSGCALPSLTHLDLFSGIGGFALAARMTGSIETVAFCEREDYAQRVLKKHWPDVPICDDIHTLKGNNYGPIDLITGGFPCQPYSLAGKRGGNDDDRALWPQMLRVIREARPTWVIGENVPGIISLALDGVLADLECEGYACETFAIPACAVDAKHRRNRVWIVAHCQKFLRDGGGIEQHQTTWKIQRQTRGGSSKATANANGGRQSQRTELNGSEAQDTTNGHSRGRHADGCSSPARWLTEPDVGRVAHGIPSRVDRLKGLGNAIVPQVAAALLSKIVEVHYGAVARHNSHSTTSVAE
jgi:DNA (cytosine-5)-methyltransferase 1